MADLLPGTEVSARGLRWEVVFTQPAGEQRLYRLRCLESALRGHELDLLVPFENIEPIATEPDPTRAARLEDWRVYHQAFLLEQELGPHALLAAQPGRLRIAAYQLVPIMRALAMARPRLLLADDVGLGKTIEAGLVLAELIARRRAHRILIVTPAGPLLQQWHREMRERFGLRFDVLDSARLKEIHYGAELGANPFDHVALGLISIDFAKQERVLQDLERSQYDVVIIDEAHHTVSLGSSGDREDSLRRRLAEVLAERADALLLLTATPHDGYDPHFASLMELLDASLVDGSGSLRGELYRKHVVRRLKRHIKDPATGAPMFRERQIFPVAVALDPASTPQFARLQQGLVALVAPQLKRALKRRRYNEVLAFIALLKRSVSTAKACAGTLGVVADRLDEIAHQGREAQEARTQRIRTLRELARRRERFGALSFEEEQDQALLEAEDMAAELAEAGAAELQEKLGFERRDARRDRARLEEVAATRDTLRALADLATAACSEDPKIRQIVELVTGIRRKEPRANVLVYSEYADSQKAMVVALDAARKQSLLTGKVLALGGEDAEGVRIARTERFTTEDDIVLVSTDASAEGLNLHERCHHLIHLELPYNPNRLEQRNGRIDRFGQKHDPIVHYLYLAGTFEERVLLRLVAKYERQKRRLGFVPNTLGLRAADFGEDVRLLEGLAEEETQLFKTHRLDLEQAAESDDTSSVAYRDMLGELDRVFGDFEKTAKAHAWLGEAGLNAGEEQIREADAARTEGTKLGAVDLVSFVTQAVLSDSNDPNAVSWPSDGVLELRLPPAWTYGLEELPGYERDTRTLRLTTELDRTRDQEDRPLGYVGRAHPIVRRALDRVRNVQFGGGGQLLDRRVGVARGDGAEPEIVYTFLGRLGSGEGRELERLIAVRCRKRAAPSPSLALAEWIALAAAERALPSRDVWKKHFAPWAKVADAKVGAAASSAFAPLAEAYAAEHRLILEREKTEIDLWLTTRAEEICGPAAAQTELFGGLALPAWRTATDPAGRLASFAADRGNSPRKRSEAQTALSLHERRQESLRRRAALERPTVSLLGLLMLVPAGQPTGGTS